MRPGCLILTATILKSSIKASRRQNIVHQGGATSCWLNTSRSRSSFTPYTEHLNLNERVWFLRSATTIPLRCFYKERFRVPFESIRIGLLNAVSAAASACHQHTPYV